MSIDNVQKFYNYTFNNEQVQNALMHTKTFEEFVALALELGNMHGYSFTKNELLSTMDGFGCSSSFEDVEWGDKWVKKIMEIGWVPLGYTRN